jgi:hypothetical protein
VGPDKDEFSFRTGLTVPYLAAQYPDELFGSWLARLFYLNAEFSFETFGRNHRLNANFKSPLADPLNGTEYALALSRLLGVDYDYFLRAFTTKAYWDAFLPIKPDDLLRFKNRSTRISLSILRICPVCIESDLKTFGCPYFHRTHQLRSRACPFHGLLLQDCCGNCNKPLRSSSETSLVPEKCACGAEVLPHLKRETANQVWTAFAEFSHKTLSAAPGELDPVYLVPYAISCATSYMGRTQSSSLNHIIFDVYGIDGLQCFYGRAGVLTIGRPGAEQRRFSLSKMSSHLATAVLSACGISFDEARQAITDLKSVPSSKQVWLGVGRHSNKTIVSSNVFEAKRIAHEFQAETPRRPCDLKIYRPYVYWRLYFSEPAWLWNCLHNTKFEVDVLDIKWDEPPSVEQDRLTILSDGPKTPRHMARARAHTRDRDWFESHKSTRNLIVDRRGTIDNVISALSLAKIQHYAEQGRPRKWTLILAAKLLSMRIHTLSNLANCDERIGNLVPELPKDFQLRVIEWGIEECQRQGLPLTTTRVIRMANLARQTPIRLVESIIYKRTAC